MNHPNRRTFQTALLAAATLPAAFAAHAQPAWPARPISLIVPFSAGGSLDATARLLARGVADKLGQAVNVENVTGAGGTIGFQRTLQAAPDGYTFLIAGDSPLNATPGPDGSYYRYDVLTALQPVALVNTAPMVLVAHPSVPANTLAELVALARRQPGRLSYATSGIGTLPHLTMEMIKHAAKMHIVHIPYRGGAQIANDVAGGQVELAMLIAASAAPHIRSKAVKAIAVTGAQRLPLLSEVPPVAQTPGFAGFDVVSWSGVYAPARTPAAVVSRMNQAIDEVLRMQTVREQLAAAGATAGGGATSAFASFITADRKRIHDVLKVTSLRE